MPIGRPLSVLNLYDIQGNLIPGLYFALIVFVLFYPWSAIPELLSSASLSFVLFALIFGVVSGRIVQAIGSALDSSKEIKRNGPLGQVTGILGPEQGIEENFAQKMETLNRISYVHTDWRELDNWILNNPATWQFLRLCKEEFDFAHYSDINKNLLFLILSYLETHGIGRAARFQALHSFYRSIWTASLLSAGISAIIWICKIAFTLNILNYEIGPPSEYLLVLTFVFIYTSWIFSIRKEKFEEICIRYVILDFYQSQVTMPEMGKNRGAKQSDSSYLS